LTIKLTPNTKFSSDPRPMRTHRFTSRRAYRAREKSALYLC